MIIENQCRMGVFHPALDPAHRTFWWVEYYPPHMLDFGQVVAHKTLLTDVIWHTSGVSKNTFFDAKTRWVFLLFPPALGARRPMMDVAHGLHDGGEAS